MSEPLPGAVTIPDVTDREDCTEPRLDPNGAKRPTAQSRDRTSNTSNHSTATSLFMWSAFGRHLFMFNGASTAQPFREGFLWSRMCLVLRRCIFLPIVRDPGFGAGSLRVGFLIRSRGIRDSTETEWTAWTASDFKHKGLYKKTTVW